MAKFIEVLDYEGENHLINTAQIENISINCDGDTFIMFSSGRSLVLLRSYWTTRERLLEVTNE